MPRIPVAIVILLLHTLPGCSDAGRIPEVPGPVDLEGLWTVVGHHAPGTATMTGAEAEWWRGRTVRLTPAGAAAAGERCDAPGYAARVVARDSFLAAEFRLTPPALGRAGLPDHLTVLDVSCGGVPWPAMGGRLLGIGPDRALAPWNGLFFELEREADFRARGQEPGWLLEIHRGREIRFIADYGADTTITPVPPVETDSATGARRYVAMTDSYDLRILIQPDSCTDVMSGERYETTVTVTRDGRPYPGCGGPLP